jgi:hypothetical protein
LLHDGVYWRIVHALQLFGFGTVGIRAVRCGCSRGRLVASLLTVGGFRIFCTRWLQCSAVLALRPVSTVSVLLDHRICLGIRLGIRLSTCLSICFSFGLSFGLGLHRGLVLGPLCVHLHVVRRYFGLFSVRRVCLRGVRVAGRGLAVPRRRLGIGLGLRGRCVCVERPSCIVTGLLGRVCGLLGAIFSCGSVTS